MTRLSDLRVFYLSPSRGYRFRRPYLLWGLVGKLVVFGWREGWWRYVRGGVASHRRFERVFRGDLEPIPWT